MRLYDTRTRAIRDFEPLQPGKVTMYVCGATVQSPPHVGHVRFAISFDLLRRWLLHQGNEVTYIRNVTDVEDKVLAKAALEKAPWWELAYRNERAFSEAYDILGCLPATLEPRATGHVPEIVALIQRLIDRGHAYASGGDVLFDVRSFSRLRRSVRPARRRGPVRWRHRERRGQTRPARLRPLEGRQAW